MILASIFKILIYGFFLFNFVCEYSARLTSNVNFDLLKKQLLLSIMGSVSLLSFYILLKYDLNINSFQFLNHLSLDAGPLSLYFGFGLDGLSLLFFILTSCILCLCVIFIWDISAIRLYGNVLISLNLILLVLFSTRDLLVLYFCFEALLIPMFLLIGLEGSRDKKIRAAYLFFFYTFLGSFTMIVALVYIYITVGTFSLAILKTYTFSELESRWLWLAFFLGFSTKIPMFPFHIWLPEAHVEAPTTGSVVLAGILLKLGVYGFIRVHLELFSESCQYFLPFVFTLCTIGVLNASFAAIAQLEIKRLIAYSSVAHMNLLTMGIFCENLMGFEGAILQCLSHAFVSSGLFFLVGCLYNRYHTKTIAYFSGLTVFMPLYSIFFTVYTFANIALPGTSAFTAEFMMLSGIYNSSPTHCFIAATSIFFGGVYSLWANNRLLFGNPKVTHILASSDLIARELIVLSMLLIFVFYAGVNADIFLKFVDLYCCETFALNMF